MMTASTTQPETTASQAARIAALEGRLARVERRRLSLALAAILLALIPLASLAANPFVDLNPGSVHNPNIVAIADAGITKGCDPGVAYCPNGLVTREEMASFLARTAGLGDNPPVANAKTAQTAASAQSAATAANAGHAATADTATTAANAVQLGGLPPTAYLRGAGDTVMRYSLTTANVIGGGGTLTPNNEGGVRFAATATGSHNILVPLPRTTTLFGIPLAIARVGVCFSSSSSVGAIIGTTGLYANERGAADDSPLVLDTTLRSTTSHSTDLCYEVPLAAPKAVAGQLYLYLRVNTTEQSATLDLHSVALTLTPVAAGAAEEAPAGGAEKPAP